MSYNARVYNVMIASPGDVEQEKIIIREVIYGWNVMHSQKNNIVLLPIGWDTHSSPEMGNPPQEILNSQILADCDLLIGVFWTRIGTPTTDYESGTVEELEKHIKLGKPAMLYFSSQPVAPDTVDPEQYEQLKAFKASCKKRGLYEEYDSLSLFKDKFQRQLQLKINKHKMFNVGSDITGDMSFVEPNTIVPKLSNEAKVLLKEATKDVTGTVMRLRHLGGTDVQTNKKNFVISNERREVARWESAIEELVSLKLLIGRGDKGEIYEVTSRGYEIADLIET